MLALRVTAFPEFTPQKISASKSGFHREAKETHGAVFVNRPHKSKRSSEKILHYYIGFEGMSEILKGGKNSGSKGKDPCKT